MWPPTVAATASESVSGSSPIVRAMPVVVSRTWTVRTAPAAVEPPTTYTSVPSAATAGYRTGTGRSPSRAKVTPSVVASAVARMDDPSYPPTMNVRAPTVAVARSERAIGSRPTMLEVPLDANVCTAAVSVLLPPPKTIGVPPTSAPAASWTATPRAPALVTAPALGSMRSTSEVVCRLPSSPPRSTR